MRIKTKKDMGLGEKAHIFLDFSLFQPTEGLPKQRPCTPGGGHLEPLPGGVDVDHVRPDGDAIEVRDLPREDAALQTGVLGRDPGLRAVHRAEGVGHHVP